MKTAFKVALATGLMLAGLLTNGWPSLLLFWAAGLTLAVAFGRDRKDGLR